MTTVLVVDDSAVDRRLVGGLLQQGGDMKVSYAADGLDALSSIEREPADIVVSDVMMPEMDGLAFVAAMRVKHPLVPVILMTSLGNEEMAVQALQAGAASYVPKRKLAQQLIDTVRKVAAIAGHQRGQMRLMDCILRSEYTFVLDNDYTLFRPLVSYLQESVTFMDLGDAADRTRLGVALEEALANALFHGNLEVSSTLKEEDDHAYFALVEERRRLKPYCDRRIFVDSRVSRNEAIFVIRDEGIGFDPTSLPDPTDPANLERVSGRGILLMKTFMDEVAFGGIGNQVTLIKRRHVNGN